MLDYDFTQIYSGVINAIESGFMWTLGIKNKICKRKTNFF